MDDITTSDTASSGGAIIIDFGEFRDRHRSNIEAIERALELLRESFAEFVVELAGAMGVPARLLGLDDLIDGMRQRCVGFRRMPGLLRRIEDEIASLPLLLRRIATSKSATMAHARRLDGWYERSARYASPMARRPHNVEPWYINAPQPRYRRNPL